MKFSKYNIFSKIRDSENYFILNALSGNADILTPLKAEEIRHERYTDIDEYMEKGYLVDEGEEQGVYTEKYREFLARREKSETQIFFVPNYTCNFSCSYCYQSGYEYGPSGLTADVIESFFRYVEDAFQGRSKYITLFGGEPLLPGKNTIDSIRRFVNESIKSELDLAIVTNGYHLVEYLDILEQGRIREVQVTLDGTEEVHNKRRVLKNGEGSFKKVVEGIDSALGRGLTVNLRVVLDRDNMENLSDLALFAVWKGWTKSPRFKTQLGRNYELHSCQEKSSKLFSRIAFFEKIYDLVQDHPEILEFHKPAFSLTRFLFESGELPEPLFDSCPACTTEWAFDYTGTIYPCTATVGKPKESIGTFYPRVRKNRERIRLWQNRDVTSIPQCRGCALQHVCGGGCGSLAKNISGNLLSPDCRPHRELMGMGISLYFEKGVA
jgi:uncharacterized protein